MRLLEQDFLSNYDIIDTSYFSNFLNNISNIKKLNNICDTLDVQVQEYFRNMLYANIITSLESYLSDAFINTVKKDKTYLRKFVETYHNFRTEKFELRELFEYYDKIEDKVTQSMLDVIYHDLRKVKGMYLDTLGIDFPNDMSAIYKAILKRHDFVHRNGKTKDGKKQLINTDDIDQLSKVVISFIKNINDQLDKL